jgi:opacity protein-like surface antigen
MPEIRRHHHAFCRQKETGIRLAASAAEFEMEDAQMKRIIAGCVALGLCLISPSFATAQERVPHRDSTAIGVDIGAFIPNDDRLDQSLLLNALYEFYVTPRVSFRTGFGWVDPSFKGGGVDSLRQMPLRLDVNYNWERGRWHPFVGAGLGAYFIQLRNNGSAFGDTETKLGLNTGGGIEYFVHRTVSIKGEGRYHAVPETLGLEPSGIALTVGLKTYF